jgi:hypothetical protein
MAWKQRKPGDIMKWGENVEVTGRYHGWRPIMVNGQESYLVDFEVTESGRARKVTYGCPTILKSLLDGVAMDHLVKVVCKGKAKTKSGQEAWQFDVFEDAPEDEELPF